MNDAGATRWSDAELLDWLNAGQTAIVVRVPAANTIFTSLALAAGAKQSMPEKAITLVDVFSDGNGNAVRLMSRDQLTRTVPRWMKAASNGVIEYAAYDPRVPDVLWVYPNAAASDTLDIAYSEPPPAATTGAGNKIQVPDQYADALLDYVLYRAFQKESEHTGDAAPAAIHLQAFSYHLEPLGVGVKNG